MFPRRGTNLVWQSTAEMVWVRGRRGIRKPGVRIARGAAFEVLLIPSSQCLAPA